MVCSASGLLKLRAASREESLEIIFLPSFSPWPFFTLKFFFFALIFFFFTLNFFFFHLDFFLFSPWSSFHLDLLAFYLGSSFHPWPPPFYQDPLFRFFLQQGRVVLFNLSFEYFGDTITLIVFWLFSKYNNWVWKFSKGWV